MYIDNKQLKNYISFWLATMFWMISLIIIVGGLTRLTDSGLSITEWELFSGLLPPMNIDQWNNYFDLYKKIPEYKLQNFSMSLEEFKLIFWWEWIHRFLARLFGLFFLLPLIFFTFKLGFKKLYSFYIIFILICFQGFIGWYMVSSGLVKRIDVSHFRLSLHLIVAFFILSQIFWHYIKIKNLKTSPEKLNYFLPFIFIILIYSQITLGGFVSGMDAGQIYNTWPLMGSSYFPDDNNYSNFFNIDIFSNPSLLQFLHRNMAYFIVILYLIILFQIYKKKIIKLYFPICLLGFLLFLQIILGILTLIYNVQILFASMHQISSIFLVTSSIYLLYLNTNIDQQVPN